MTVPTNLFIHALLQTALLLLLAACVTWLVTKAAPADAPS